MHSASRFSEGLQGHPETIVNVPTGDLVSQSIDVYFVDGHRYLSDGEVADILAFCNNGGGVIVGGQAWYWGYSMSTDQSYADFDGNKYASDISIRILRP